MSSSIAIATNPICIASNNIEIVEKLNGLLEEIGAKNVNPVNFFQLPTTKSSMQCSVFIADVTEVPPAGTQQIEAMLEYCKSGATIILGKGESGSRVAHWMRNGAVDYLDWLPELAELKRSITIALRHAACMNKLKYEYRILQERRNSITSGEQEVLAMVMDGLPNKAIAARLAVSQRTVEARRQKVYQKMGANKLVDLIRAIDRLERISFEINSVCQADRVVSLANSASAPVLLNGSRRANEGSVATSVQIQMQ